MPQVCAVRVNLLVPRAEPLKRDTHIRIDRPAAVTVLDQVESLAVVYDTEHLGRRARGLVGWLGRSLRRGGRAGQVDADVVVEPEVRAVCKGCLLNSKLALACTEGGQVPLLISLFHLLSWAMLIPWPVAMVSHWLLDEIL